MTRVAYAEGSPYPGNAALGVVDDVALTRDVYAAIGGDLARLGININLAPCADVLVPGGSAVVGTRSFGSDPDLVARHVTAAVAGLQGAGVAACAKHFPGHGSTAADSHLALATVSGTMADLRARDLPPFAAAIAAGTLAVMPGHLRVPELTGDLPATLSPAAVTGLLRGELGFDGVVICDALEMKAASAAYGIPEAAVLAVIAGVDLLCLGRDTDEAMYHAVRAALADAVASGRLPRRPAGGSGRPGRGAPGLARQRPRGRRGRRARCRRGRRDRPAGRPARAAAVRPGPRPAGGPAGHRGRAGGEHRGRAIHLGLRPVGGGTASRSRRPATGRRRARSSRAAEGRPLVLAVRHGAGALPLVNELLGGAPGRDHGGHGGARLDAAAGDRLPGHLRRVAGLRPGRGGSARPRLSARGRVG